MGNLLKGRRHALRGQCAAVPQPKARWGFVTRVVLHRQQILTHLLHDVEGKHIPSFAASQLWQHAGLWHQDGGILKLRLLALPKDVQYSDPGVHFSLSCLGCDTTTGDGPLLRVMAGLGHDGLCVLRM